MAALAHRIRLEKRPRAVAAPGRSATPLLAVARDHGRRAGSCSPLLGKDPVLAIRTIFWDPLFGDFASYTRPQLLIKAAPLILIAHGPRPSASGPASGTSAPRASTSSAPSAAPAAGLAALPGRDAVDLPADGRRGRRWAALLWALIPAVLRVRFGTNEILVSLMLVYVAQNLLAWAALGPLKNPEGMGFPGSRNLAQWASSRNLELIPAPARTGRRRGAGRGGGGLRAARPPRLRLRGAAHRPRPRAAAFAGVRRRDWCWPAWAFGALPGWPGSSR